jgi:hypothetical protein
MMYRISELMQTTLRYLLLLALVSVPLAHAEEAEPCGDGTLATLAHWAGVKGKLIGREKPGGVVAAATCKPMPDAPNTIIAAVAFDTSHRDPSQGNPVHQVIALIEDDKVVAAHRSVVMEDAHTVFGLYRIDTAPYILAPKVRAFGVEIDSGASGPDCPDAMASYDLTLWIREGEQLRPVFGTNRYGWVAADKLSCPGVEGARGESASMTIAVEKTSSHGFADLSLTAHATHTQFMNGDIRHTGKRTVHTILKYDGTSYGVDMFRNFWYPHTSPAYKAENEHG